MLGSPKVPSPYPAHKLGLSLLPIGSPRDGLVVLWLWHGTKERSRGTVAASMPRMSLREGRRPLRNQRVSDKNGTKTGTGPVSCLLFPSSPRVSRGGFHTDISGRLAQPYFAAAECSAIAASEKGREFFYADGLIGMVHPTSKPADRPR